MFLTLPPLIPVNPDRSLENRISVSGFGIPLVFGAPRHSKLPHQPTLGFGELIRLSVVFFVLTFMAATLSSYALPQLNQFICLFHLWRGLAFSFPGFLEISALQCDLTKRHDFSRSSAFLNYCQVRSDMLLPFFYIVSESGTFF